MIHYVVSFLQVVTGIATKRIWTKEKLNKVYKKIYLHNGLTENCNI